MLARVILFLELNPEFKPALWLAAAYLGLYLLMVVLLSLTLSLRVGEPPKPFADRIVHTLLFAFLVCLAAASVYFVIRMYRDPLYFLFWYHYATYAAFFLVNIILAAGLVRRLWYR